MIGRLVAGRFLLQARVGDENESRSFLATDTQTHDRAVVKLLVDGDDRSVRRFEREAEITADLGIPGVVRLIAHGREAGLRYLATAFAEGAPFPGPSPLRTWRELAPVAQNTLRVLDAVHRRGILHRDLKPHNVLVTASGEVTLLDFGLSRLREGTDSLTRTGDILGTAHYQAPEQILADRPVDARADLYALGAMFYECLTGTPPHTSGSVGRTYASRLLLRPIPILVSAPTVPSNIAAIIHAMLAPSPDDRPATAADVAEALLNATPVRRAGELPWLGGVALEERLEAALRQGSTVHIGGLKGSGKSSLIIRLCSRIQDLNPLVLVAGEHPYESMSRPLAVSIQDTEEARRALENRVLIVDDAGAIDPWTSEVLAAAGRPSVWSGVPPLGDRGPATSQREASAGGVIHAEQPRLTQADVVSLFFGDDGTCTSLLLERTDGLPSRISAEVAAWVVAGWARWVEDRLVLIPEAADLLREGPPPDPRLGRSSVELPTPLTATLAAIGAQPGQTPADMARSLERPLWQVTAECDRLTDLGVVGGFPHLRVRPDVALDESAWREAIAARAAQSTWRVRPGLLNAAQRWDEASTEAHRAAERLVDEGRPGAAWAQVYWAARARRELGEPVADLAALGSALTRLLGTPSARHLLVSVGVPYTEAIDLVQFRAIAERDPAGTVLADEVGSLPLVRAVIALARGRPKHALEVLDVERITPAMDVEARLLRIEALLEDGQFEDAIRTAESLRGQEGVPPRLLCNAELLSADAAHRLGRGVHDVRLAARISNLGIPSLLAYAWLLEAAMAWRRCEYEIARRVADQASNWTSPVGLLARGVSIACGAEADPISCRQAIEQVDRMENPGVSLQIRGLVAIGAPGLAAGLLPDVQRLHDEAPDYVGVALSSAEALAFTVANARARRR